jgi:hypothetical protein
VACAPAGLRVLRDAGCRAVFMKDPSDAAEVEAVPARDPIDAVSSRHLALLGARSPAELGPQHLRPRPGG